MLHSINTRLCPLFMFRSLSSTPLIFMNRSRSISVPVIANVQELRLVDFEASYEKLDLPKKLTHSDKKEVAKEFVKSRLEQYPNGMEPINEEDYRDLYLHLPREEREKIKNDISLVVLYYNLILSKSIFCPTTIPFEDMRKMVFNYTDYKSRLRNVQFLFIREFDNWRHERAKEIRRQQRLIEEANVDKSAIGCFNENGNLQYGNWGNCLFYRHTHRRMDYGMRLYSLHRLRQAELFGQKLVLDCSFDETMADYETISIARQLGKIYNANRYQTRNPFHLLFCGYRESSRGFQYTNKMMKDIIKDPGHFFNFRTETYQELCAGEKLIYLSPDAEEVMTEFDHDAVYIIGALVSKTHKCQSTYDKATREGIQCLRLPLQQYVTLRQGVKNVLSFQGVFKILLELKEHGDWERALRAGIQDHKLEDGDKTDDISDSDDEIKSD